MAPNNTNSGPAGTTCEVPKAVVPFLGRGECTFSSPAWPHVHMLHCDFVARGKTSCLWQRAGTECEAIVTQHFKDSKCANLYKVPFVVSEEGDATSRNTKDTAKPKMSFPH